MKTILIAHPHRLIADGLFQLLLENECQLQPQFVQSEKELQAISAPQCSIALVSTLLWHGHNHAFQRALRIKYPETPLILLDSNSANTPHRQGRIGINGRLDKNAPVAHFVSAVKTVLLDPSITPMPLAFERKWSLSKPPPLVSTQYTEFGLTNRPLDTLALLIDGKSNAQIAQFFFREESTIKTHCKVIFKAFGENNRHAIICLARDMPSLKARQQRLLSNKHTSQYRVG